MFPFNEIHKQLQPEIWKLISWVDIYRSVTGKILCTYRNRTLLSVNTHIDLLSIFTTTSKKNAGLEQNVRAYQKIKIFPHININNRKWVERTDMEFAQKDRGWDSPIDPPFPPPRKSTRGVPIFHHPPPFSRRRGQNRGGEVTWNSAPTPRFQPCWLHRSTALSILSRSFLPR